jgi:hypothetical protein
MTLEDHTTSTQRDAGSSAASAATAAAATTWLQRVGREAAGGIVEVDSTNPAAVPLSAGPLLQEELRRPNLKTLKRLFPAASAATLAATNAPRTATAAVVAEALRLTAHSLGAIRKVGLRDGNPRSDCGCACVYICGRASVQRKRFGV